MKPKKHKEGQLPKGKTCAHCQGFWLCAESWSVKSNNTLCIFGDGHFKEVKK